MKKITTILTTLILAIGTENIWAAVGSGNKLTNLNDLVSTEAFTIVTAGRGALVTDGTNLKTTISTTATPEDPAQQFLIIKDGENYYLKSLALHKFAKYDSEQVVSFVESIVSASSIRLVYATDHWKLYFGGTGNIGRFNGQSGGNFRINNWEDAEDDGNKITITSVGDASNITNVTYNVNVGSTTKETGTYYAISGSTTYLPSYLYNGYTFTYSSETISGSSLTLTLTYQSFANIAYSADYSSAHWYNMTIRDAEKFVTYDSSSTPNVKTATTNAQTTQQWAFVGNPWDGFTIYNNAAGSTYFLGFDTSATPVVELGTGYSSKWYVEPTNTRTNGFYLRYESTTGKRPNWQDNQLKYWDGADYGSAFVVEEPRVAVNYIIKYNGTEVERATGVGAVAGGTPDLPTAYKRDYCTYAYDIATVSAGTTDINVTVTWDGPFTISTSYNDATWYILKINNKYTYWDDTNKLCPDKSTKNVAGYGQWAFDGDPYNGFKIYNRGLDNNYTLNDLNGGNTTKVQMTNSTTGNNLWKVKKDGDSFQLYTESSKYLNDDGSNSCMIIYSGGSKMQVENAPTDYATYAVSDIYDAYINVPQTYFYPTETFRTSLGWNNSYNTACTYDQYNTMRGKADKFTNADLLWPETGYYRLKNRGYNTYFGQNTATIMGNFSSENANGPATVVKLTKGTGENAYKYSIAIQGPYLNAVAQSSAVPTSTTEQFFTVGIETCGYAGFSVAGSGYTYLHCDGSGNIVGWSLGNLNSQWSLEKATDFTVPLTAVGDAYYATLCVPFGATAPSGTTAYTIALNDAKTQANGTEVESGAITAGTPVVLVGNSASATFTIGTGYAATPLTTTSLTGNYLPTTIVAGKSSNNYVLGKEGTVIGFYHWEGTTLAANRAYLNVPAGARGFALVFGDEASGISGVNGAAAVAAGSVYDLQGRRVAQSAKGLNIVRRADGTTVKVMVK